MIQRLDFREVQVRSSGRVGSCGSTGFSVNTDLQIILYDLDLNSADVMHVVVPETRQ